MTDSRSSDSRIAVALAATLLLAILGTVLLSPATVRAQETGSVVFRLTIEGPVPPDDDFALGRTADPCCFNDPVHVFCGAGIGTSAEPCEARTYEIGYEFPVGTVIDYAYRRWPGGNADAAETFYSGEVTVQAQEQVIAVTYQYGGGGGQQTPASGTGTGTGGTPAPQPTPAPAVPDTAMPRAAVRPIVVLGALLLAGAPSLVMLRRSR
jgi:hypothetical protein